MIKVGKINSYRIIDKGMIEWDIDLHDGRNLCLCLVYRNGEIHLDSTEFYFPSGGHYYIKNDDDRKAMQELIDSFKERLAFELKEDLGD